MKKLISNTAPPLSYDIKWHMANSGSIGDATVEIGLRYQRLAQELSLNSTSDLLVAPQMAQLILPQIGKMLQHYSGKKFDTTKVTLEKLVEEVQQYIAEGKLTHEYYILLSLRLCLLATPEKYHTKDKRNNFTDKEATHLLENWENPDLLAKKFREVQSASDSVIAKHIKTFPEFCYLPTTAGNLTLEDLNKQFGTSVWLIGLTTELTVADDLDMHPIHFAWHDASGHLQNFTEFVIARLEISPAYIRKIMDAYEGLKIAWRHNQAFDKIQKLEFVIFMALHELYSCSYALSDTSSKDIPTCKKSMHQALQSGLAFYSDPRWYQAIFPGDTRSDSSIQSVLSELIETVYEPLLRAIQT